MKKLLIATIAFFSLGFPVFSQGTVPAPVPPPKKQVGEFSEAQMANSLRFVAIDRIDLDDVYMFVAKDQYKKLPIRMGTPGERVPVPAGKRVLFFESIPVDKQKVTPLLDLQLPENLPARTIVLLGKNQGKVYAIYVDESSLRPGTALLKNMTNKPYLIDMPEAPGQEEKRFLLAGGKDHMFGSKASMDGADGKTYRAIWRHEILTKDGSKKWFVERKMMIKRYKNRALIILIRPDDKGVTYVLNEIMFFLPTPRPQALPGTGPPRP